MGWPLEAFPEAWAAMSFSTAVNWLVIFSASLASFFFMSSSTLP